MSLGIHHLAFLVYLNNNLSRLTLYTVLLLLFFFLNHVPLYLNFIKTFNHGILLCLLGGFPILLQGFF